MRECACACVCVHVCMCVCVCVSAASSAASSWRTPETWWHVILAKVGWTRRCDRLANPAFMTNHRSKKPLSSDDRAVRSVLLSPKSSIRVGCWNVRPLGNPTKQNSRLREVLCTMSEKGTCWLSQRSGGLVMVFCTSTVMPSYILAWILMTRTTIIEVWQWFWVRRLSLLGRVLAHVCVCVCVCLCVRVCVCVCLYGAPNGTKICPISLRDVCLHARPQKRNNKRVLQTRVANAFTWRVLQTRVANAFSKRVWLTRSHDAFSKRVWLTRSHDAFSQRVHLI